MRISLWRALLALLSLSALVVALFGQAAALAQPVAPAEYTIYLPIVTRFQTMPFGAQTAPGWIGNAMIIDRAQNLGIQWVRLDMGGWSKVQPTRGAPYNVTALATFERDLKGALDAKLTPLVALNNSPEWATINKPFPTSCGAIRTDRLDDFAAFMGWLAARYKGRVDYWEIGNEPDADPRLLPPNHPFGCWGDIDDPYYGGEQYGRMLNVVTPAIKRANPSAQVVIGGLILPYEGTAPPGQGQPANFFEGILRAGAGNNFDIVAYHSYPSYTNQPLDFDYDIDPYSDWAKFGGYTIGKANFLRRVMAKYGINRLLSLDETALVCSMPPEGTCAGPSPTFFRAQADYAIRMMTRAWSIGVQQVVWYTLQGPGWHDSGLLDEQQRPRQVYLAYQQYITMTNHSDPPVLIHDYDRSDVSIEAYRFSKGPDLVDLVWAKDLSTYYVQVPVRFVKAYTQYGQELKPIGPYIPVGFSPVYIHHKR
jgi:hypothetical protein